MPPLVEVVVVATGANLCAAAKLDPIWLKSIEMLFEIICQVTFHES